MLEREKFQEEAAVVVSFAGTGSVGDWYSPSPMVALESNERVPDFAFLSGASRGYSAESMDLARTLFDVLRTLDGSSRRWFEEWHVGSADHPALMPGTEALLVPSTPADSQVVTLNASISRVEYGNADLGLTDEEWRRFGS